jgi:hypothetical protein
MCPYCELDTAGNHKLGCPNNPVKMVTLEDITYKQIMGEIIPKNPVTRQVYMVGTDIGIGSDFVGVSSEEYKRPREYEKENIMLREMLNICDPFVVNPESECQECGQGVGEICCVFCGNSIEVGHAEDCKYVREVKKKC